MSDGYYPEYYLRKRKKDRVYGLVTRLVIVLVVVGGLGCLTGFFAWQYVLKPRKTAGGITPEMAHQRQDLATEQRLAVAARQPLDLPPATANVEFQPTQLTALSYAESMPLTSVGLIGTGSSSAAAQPVASPAAATQAPPSTAAEQQPAPAESLTDPEPAIKVTLPEDKAEAKQPKPDTKAEQDKAAKAKEEAKEREKDKPKDPPAPVKPRDSAPMFKVYAGSSSSRDEAEKLRGQLSGLGLSGSVLKVGGDFLVLVATVDEYSKAEALTSDLQGKGFSAFSTRSKGK